MKETVIHFPNTWMTISALTIFMALFIGFVIYVYFLEGKKSQNYKESIPFQVEEGHE
jgi:hypothetical protein